MARCFAAVDERSDGGNQKRAVVCVNCGGETMMKRSGGLKMWRDGSAVMEM